jgi:Mitochondrial carrier protein
MATRGSLLTITPIRSLKAACFVRVPTEVIKTRSQTSSYGALANSSLATAKLVWKTDRLKGFYRGFGITVMREVIISLAYFPDRHLSVDWAKIPFASLQFPMYEFFKHRLSLLLYHKPSSLRPYEASLCGSVAGGIAAAVTTPLDVLKTRIMLDLRVRLAGFFFRGIPLTRLRTHLILLTCHHSADFGRYIWRRGFLRCSLVSFQGPCGSRPVGPCFWVCTSGL